MNDPDFRAPWEIVDYGYGLKIEPEICWIGDTTSIPKDQQKAIARLIKAAPDMLKALSEAVEKYGKPGGPWNVPGEPGSWIEKAKAALKKARGKA